MSSVLTVVLFSMAGCLILIHALYAGFHHQIFLRKRFVTIALEFLHV